MDKNNKEQYIAEVENPENGETIRFVGVSESDVESQAADFFDFGLDENGVYVGDEADE
jgi:hypothetical protein